MAPEAQTRTMWACRGWTAIAAIVFANALEASVVSSTDVLPDEMLQVVHMEKPAYPARALAEGLGYGEVEVLLAIDETGKLRETLPVAYTHKIFADALSRSVKDWIFSPAKQNGRPIPTVLRVELKFHVGDEGMVFVDRKGPANISRLGKFAGGKYAFRPCAREELDAPLQPVHRSAPAYPQSLKSAGVGGRVRVDFYIDGTGITRFPTVGESVHPILAAAAAQAISEWRFEPPKRRGQPALVHATQVFDFVP